VVGGIDGERVTDPIKPDEELCETVHKSCERGTSDRPGRRHGAIQQQHKNAEAQKNKGKDFQRRKGQRRQRAGYKGGKQTPPAGKPAEEIADSRHACSGIGGAGRMRSRLIRRGSASSTSNS